MNGPWRTIIDPYDSGFLDYRLKPYDEAPDGGGGIFRDRQQADRTELLEYDFSRSPTLNVPGDWNSQDASLLYYEGTVWYRRLFDWPVQEGRRLFLHFGGANYHVDVYLNGLKLGVHDGGFTPFEFEVTGKVRPKENSLVVRVDNRRHPEAVPTVNTDWWNFGGITREVRLVETPETLIRTHRVQLKKGTLDRIQAWAWLDGPRHRQRVVLTIAEAGIRAESQTDETGAVCFEIEARGLELWLPERPRLYDVELAGETDRITDKIGFRSLAVVGSDILLNGKSVFLRGISLHEEVPLQVRRAHSEADARLLLGWARELGCNFVRLAHYPHNEHMARVADEIGLMLWEEVPVYWTIHWENPATFENARSQLADLVIRDRNRASVIIWSVANETPISEPRTRFLKALVDTARSLDDSRLVSAAMEVRVDPADPNGRIVDDPLMECTDLLSFNQYIGWYDGLPDRLERIHWSFGAEKPIFISEFGADAKVGFPGDALTRFSEEYQADLYRRTLEMLGRIPGWRGASPWILCDFRSPRRHHPTLQNGWNRKGLISSDGVKKKAFGVLKRFYETLSG